MLHTNLLVALSSPSERPGPTPGRTEIADVAPILLGAAAGAGTLTSLLHGFEAAGFQDVLSIVDDGRPVYVDHDERPDDLELARHSVLSCPSLRRGLCDVHLVLSHRDQGIHTLADVRINDRALLSNTAISIRLSSRLSTLCVRSGEGPALYQQRVLEALAGGEWERATTVAQGLAQRLAERLGAWFERIVTSKLSARVVIPGPAQVGAFRNLAFGDRVSRPVYRALRGAQRSGAYHDAHTYHYYDAYHDLLAWILCRETLEGRWPATGVDFIDEDGLLVFRGGQMPRAPLDVPLDAVFFGPSWVEVAASVPWVGVVDPVDEGLPASGRPWGSGSASGFARTGN